MAGSRLQVIVPDNTIFKHSDITGRNEPLQHDFDSLYREIDGKTLTTVISELSNKTLICKSYDIPVDSLITVSKIIPFVDSGIIKGIKVTGTESTENFSLGIWTKMDGYWVYYSGVVTNVLWDIMDIPFIDESGQNSLYIQLKNDGPSDLFHVQIYITI